MNEGILSIDPMKLTSFRKYFPEMAAVQSITTFQIEENSLIIGYTVYFLGPFLYGVANDNSNTFLIYVPHYIIRYAPKTVLIELLPFHKFLKKKLIFHFKNLDDKNEIYTRLKYSQSCKNMFPPTSFSFDFQCYKLNPETQILTQNQFCIGENNILSLSSFKGKFCVDVDSKISTLYDDNRIQTSIHPFCFALYSLFPETVYIITKDLDTFLISFLAIERMIHNIHTFAILNSIDQNRFSLPFPVKKIQYYWPEQNEMKCKDMKMICSNIVYNNEIKFKDFVRIPEKASNNLQIMSFDQNKKRTVLLSYSEYWFNKHNFKQENETNKAMFYAKNQLINTQNDSSNRNLKNLFNEEIQQIIETLENDENSLSLSSISDSQTNITHQINDINSIIKISNEDEIFKWEKIEKKSDVFSIYEKYGKELFFDYIGLPTVDNSITEYCNMIGLAQNQDEEAFPEQNFFAFLESKICSLPQNVSIYDDDFKYIFKEIVNILKDNLNELVFFDFLDQIKDNFTNIKNCLPQKQQQKRFELFILRLIIKKHLSSFIALITDKRNIMKHIFNEFSPLFSTSFFSSFLHFIHLLNNYSITSEFNSDQYFDHIDENISLLEVPDMISTIIWDKTKLLTSLLRKEIFSKDVETYFYNFIFSIVEFLNRGFIIKNKEYCRDCWFLFNKLSYTRNDSVNSLFQVSQEIIESMKEKTAHILLLDLAKIAKEEETHKKKSPILSYFSTTVVSQCIYQISIFDITPFTNYQNMQRYFSFFHFKY